jgi:hypothetical protein
VPEPVAPVPEPERELDPLPVVVEPVEPLVEPLVLDPAAPVPVLPLPVVPVALASAPVRPRVVSVPAVREAQPVTSIVELSKPIPIVSPSAL